MRLPLRQSSEEARWSRWAHDEFVETARQASRCALRLAKGLRMQSDSHLCRARRTRDDRSIGRVYRARQENAEAAVRAARATASILLSVSRSPLPQPMATRRQ